MLNILERWRHDRRERAALDERRPSDRRPEDHVVSLVAPASFAAERYRVLRYTIEQMHKDADIRVLAITSPTVGDGKTTTAVNLAGALAQAPDARVLLVDADLRRGQVQATLALCDSYEPGLAETIVDPNVSLTKVIRRCPEFNLSVLPAGRCPAAPYEALKSPRLAELVHEMRRDYDYVVLDTAPLLPVPDSRMLTKCVDGFLMVVGAHKTGRRLVEEAFDIIDPAKVLGVVFNGDDSPISSYSSYGYGLYAVQHSNNGGSRERLWRRWIGRKARRVAS
jgi:capsular exopolysaccharide synthesis family protein